jgi:eukaryotic-like serine/threonine-protein kinase
MERIGRYEILHRIGSGGMAEVFLGRTTGEGGFEKIVALKRILPHMTTNEDLVRMFIDEARISATLSHSNIGQIFEFGKADQSYFIAMEYVQGVDLRSVYRHFQRQRALPPAPVAAFVIKHVCAALEHAHSKLDSQGRPLGIIHRDVSPSNVLLSFEGEVKLIDFGIAKATHRMSVTVGASLKGKYAYMSPEQAAGLPMDHRSDIFGAGTLLFELLTGLNPFLGETDFATLERVRKGRSPAPSSQVREIPLELDRICLRALARDPKDRYSSAGDMEEALEAYCQRAAFSARQMARWIKKHLPEEIEEKKRMVQQARERSQARLRSVSSAELQSTLPEVPKIEAAVLEAPKPEAAVLEAPKPEAPKPEAAVPEARSPRGTPRERDSRPRESRGSMEAPSREEFDEDAATLPPPPSQLVVESRGATDRARQRQPPAIIPSVPPGRAPSSGLLIIEESGKPQEAFTNALAPGTATTPVGKIAIPTSPTAPGGPPPFVAAPSAGATGPGSLLTPVFKPTPASQLTPVSQLSPPSPGRRTNPWLHVIGFIAFAVLVLLGVYYFAGRSDQPALRDPSRGSLEIRIHPPFGAQIFLDEEIQGALTTGGPFTVENILPGKHRLEVKGSQFQPLEKIIEVPPGKTVLDLEVIPR